MKFYSKEMEDEIVANVKESLLKNTSIRKSQDNMKVVDDVLHECCKMGWLDGSIIDDIDNMVRFDTVNVTPNCDVYEECQHTALNKKNNKAIRDVDFNCNIATRYYEDKNYARAYALSPYECGVMILCNKQYNAITISVLGEDDGAWFISDNSKLEYIGGKSNFIGLVSEALSVFNNNYKE